MEEESEPIWMIVIGYMVANSLEGMQPYHYAFDYSYLIKIIK